MNKKHIQAPASPAHLLQTIFGFEEFRPLQEEIISSVLSRQDGLVIMPTGGGKSLCYQIPALIFDGLTVVVSPLIALMKDQVEQLEALGVPALFLNSSLAWEDYAANMERVRSGEIKLLYVAPETLFTDRILGLLSRLKVDLLAVDEAHCISEWGHDFRPEYRQLAAFRQRFPQAACLAMTATATRRVRQDIQQTLLFDKAHEYIASFDRPNLFIEVQPKKRAEAQAVEFVRRFKDQSGIIYCFSRRQVEELADVLARRGFSVRPYHAGLEDEVRKQNQELFIRDDVQIIVATIAFGMGINKPNVRFILHYDLPRNIESYYQEIGRAGRDGLPAHCLLLYSYADTHKIEYFIKDKDEPERSHARQHLRDMTAYAEADICRRVPLLNYFGEAYTTENCGNCDNCRSVQRQEQVDLTIPAQKFMSCVRRSGERFGAGHIADLLMGIENEKVLKFGHQTLSTFGIGTEHSQKEWMHLARQLLQKGLLERTEHSGLKLTQAGYLAITQRQAVMGAALKDSAALKDGAAPLKEPAGLEQPWSRQSPEIDQDLFELLRRVRKALADREKVPPYVILPDRSLLEIATYYPMSLESLAVIHGIGEAKLKRYGKTLIEAVQTYCQERGLVEKTNPKLRGSLSSAPKVEKKLRYIEVGEAYNAGQSVEHIAQAYSVQTGTVLEHLARYAQEGNPLRADHGLQMPNLSEALQERAMQAFAENGTAYLRLIFDALGEAVSYDDIKLLRLQYLISKNGKEAQ